MIAVSRNKEEDDEEGETYFCRGGNQNRMSLAIQVKKKLNPAARANQWCIILKELFYTQFRIVKFKIDFYNHKSDEKPRN